MSLKFKIVFANNIFIYISEYDNIIYSHYQAILIKTFYAVFT